MVAPSAFSLQFDGELSAEDIRTNDTLFEDFTSAAASAIARSVVDTLPNMAECPEGDLVTVSGTQL